MSPISNLNTAFDHYLNGTASDEDLRILLASFLAIEAAPLKNRIRLELELEQQDNYAPNLQLISNRVFKKLAQTRLQELSKKYRDNSISPDELTELQASVLVSMQAAGTDELPTKGITNKHEAKGRRWKKTKPQQQLPEVQNKNTTINAWHVSSLIVLLSAILGFIVFSYRPNNTIQDTRIATDIKLPLLNEARITFEDGKSLALLNSNKTELAKRGVEIIQQPQSELTFKIHAIPGEKMNLQTFHAPKGSMCKLILSDNTSVWLNSQASISYPNTFSKKHRQVKVQGELYFEVSPNTSKPFTVIAANTQVHVLGTAFNVKMDGKSHKVHTTLIHGSVALSTKTAYSTIKPGTQGTMDSNTGTIDSKKVNVTEELAWKNGYFKFKDEDVYSVLDQLKTWYDIADYDIQAVTNDRFSGTILRTQELSTLLRQLEKISNYTFKIKDRRVYVMK